MADIWLTKPPLPVGTSPNGRYLGCAAYYQGKVYYAQGQDGNGNISGNLYVYDVATETWSTLAAAPQGARWREMHPYQGKLYLTNGTTAGANPQTIQIYDIATDTYTDSAAAPRKFTTDSSALYDGRIYCWGQAGSGGTYIYNIATNTWVPGVALPNGNTWQNYGCAVVGDKAYLVGGYDSVSVTWTGQMFIYNFLNDSWVQGPSMSLPRGSLDTAAVSFGKYVIVGPGAGNPPAPSCVEKLDTSTLTWETLASTQVGSHSGCSMAASSSKLWVIAGGESSADNDFEEMVPTAFSVTDPPVVPTTDDVTTDQVVEIVQEVLREPHFRGLTLPHTIKPNMDPEKLVIALQQNFDAISGWARQFSKEA